MSFRDDKVTLLELSAAVDMRAVYFVVLEQQILTVVVGAAAVCVFADEDRCIPFVETGRPACDILDFVIAQGQRFRF